MMPLAYGFGDEFRLDRERRMRDQNQSRAGRRQRSPGVPVLHDQGSRGEPFRSRWVLAIGGQEIDRLGWRPSLHHPGTRQAIEPLTELFDLLLPRGKEDFWLEARNRHGLEVSPVVLDDIHSRWFPAQFSSQPDTWDRCLLQPFLQRGGVVEAHLLPLAESLLGPAPFLLLLPFPWRYEDECCLLLVQATGSLSALIEIVLGFSSYVLIYPISQTLVPAGTNSSASLASTTPSQPGR